jgi:GT2 family glycosyltransferase
LSNVKVAVVILNYNSEKDLKICVEQISRQKGVHFSIILVDNASQTKSIAEIDDWLAETRPDAVVGTQQDVQTWVEKNSDRANESGNIYFVKNHENRGYSAGNNIGIRLADFLGVDAVLIANPDMRIEDPNYLDELSLQLFADKRNYIAASRIIGLDGKDQNPLREATFWEEVFWPRAYLHKLFGKVSSYLLPVTATKPVVVPKVSGCCLMLRMSFLKKTNYLDESVFLYCEEPILAARVWMYGGRLIYIPSLIATHAHVSSEKGNAACRMLMFINSRNYYLKNYTDYQGWQLKLLSCSYAVLTLIYKIKMTLIKFL